MSEVLQRIYRSRALRLCRERQHIVLVQAFTERPDVTLLLSATFEGLDLVSQRHRTTMLASLSTSSQGFSSVCTSLCRVHSVMALYAAFRALRTIVLVNSFIISCQSIT